MNLVLNIIFSISSGILVYLAYSQLYRGGIVITLFVVLAAIAISGAKGYYYHTSVSKRLTVFFIAAGVFYESVAFSTLIHNQSMEALTTYTPPTPQIVMPDNIKNVSRELAYCVAKHGESKCGTLKQQYALLNAQVERQTNAIINAVANSNSAERYYQISIPPMAATISNIFGFEIKTALSIFGILFAVLFETSHYAINQKTPVRAQFTEAENARFARTRFDDDWINSDLLSRIYEDWLRLPNKTVRETHRMIRTNYPELRNWLMRDSHLLHNWLLNKSTGAPK